MLESDLLNGFYLIINKTNSNSNSYNSNNWPHSNSCLGSSRKGSRRIASFSYLIVLVPLLSLETIGRRSTVSAMRYALFTGKTKIIIKTVHRLTSLTSCIQLPMIRWITSETLPVYIAAHTVVGAVWTNRRKFTRINECLEAIDIT